MTCREAPGVLVSMIEGRWDYGASPWLGEDSMVSAVTSREASPEAVMRIEATSRPSSA